MSLVRIRLGILLLLLPMSQSRRPPSFRIGSIFMINGKRQLEEGFRRIVESVNQNPHYLNGTRIDFDTQYSRLDLFDSHQKICTQIQYKVLTVFGSAPPIVDTSAAAVCNALNIPYFSTASPPSAVAKSAAGANKFAVHLAPTQDGLVDILVAMIDTLRWKEAAFIYHRSTATLDVQTVMDSLHAKLGKGRVTFLELKHSDSRGDIVGLRNSGLKNFIVDVEADLLPIFFNQALKSGIIHSESTIIASSLDFSSVNMDDFKHTGANFLGLTITSTNEIEQNLRSGLIIKELALMLRESYQAALLYDGIQLFSKAAQAWFDQEDLVTPAISCQDQEAPYEKGPALLSQILKMEHRGITGHLKFADGLRTTTQADIIRLLPSGRFATIGHWRQNGPGKPELKLTKEDAVRTFHKGSMAFPGDVIFQDGSRYPDSSRPILVVETILDNPPFMSLTGFDDPESADEAGSKYEGFLKDLLDMLAKDIGFDYVLQASVRYGNVDPVSGNWSGLVGKLISRSADLAAADLTVTSQRSLVVDFTVPFLTTDLTLVVARKDKRADGDSATASPATVGLMGLGLSGPFSLYMWLSILVAYLLISLLLFFVGRISPFERLPLSPQAIAGHVEDDLEDEDEDEEDDGVVVGPEVKVTSRSFVGRSSKRFYPNGKDVVGRLDPVGPVPTSKTFSVANAFWFTMSGFFLRSVGLHPRSLSARCLSASWWLFCLVILVLYFLNLRGAHRPEDQPDQRVRNIEDFLADPESRVGFASGGATHQLLTASDNDQYKRLLSKANLSKRYKSTAEAIQEVLFGADDDDGAEDGSSREATRGFLMEGVQASRLLKQFGDRQLWRLDGSLGTRMYALALPMGSPYTDLISRRILEYSEDGRLFGLASRWLSSSAESNRSRLAQGLEQSPGLEPPAFFRGPFLLLLVAALVSMVIAFLEMLCYAGQKRRRKLDRGVSGSSYKQTFGSVIEYELREAFGCAPPVVPRTASRRPDNGFQAVVGSPPLKEHSNMNGSSSPTTSPDLFSYTKEATSTPSVAMNGFGDKHGQAGRTNGDGRQNRKPRFQQPEAWQASSPLSRRLLHNSGDQQPKGHHQDNDG